MPKLIGKNANQVPVNGYLGNMAFQDKASVEVDELTVTGKALVGGDTAAGDAAAIGYTATEGLILTGQGSTNDVTIKNDADATVFSIPTGSTQVAINSGASGATANPSADELVVESSGNGGINILGPDGTFPTLLLGDVTDSGSLKVQWDSGNSVGIVGTAKGSAELVLAYGNGTEALRIDSSGNVGIGTSSPQNALHVAAADATLRLTTTSDSGQAGIEFWDNQSGTSQAAAIRYYDVTNLFTIQGNANGTIFMTPSNTFPSGSEAMRIDSNGRVGIGTSSPVAQIHSETASGTLQTRTKVVGTAVSDIAELAIATGSRTYLMQSKGSTGDFVIRDSTGAADRFTIDSTGEATFSGDIVVENGVPVVTVKTTSATGRSDINFADPASSAAGTLSYQHNGDYLQVKVAATEVTRFDADGLKFNGDTAAANALDDYEEGTFTPVLTDGTNSVSTYYYQSGYYTKIGNVVNIWIDISVNNKGSISGNLHITGLPFTSASGTGQEPVLATQTNSTGTGMGDLVAMVETSTTQVALRVNGTISTEMDDTDIFGGTQLHLTGTYFV